MAKSDRTQNVYMALGGVMASGSLVFLWLACTAPSGRLGLTAAAGLFPMAAALYGGRAAGYLCWAAASLLGFFMLPDKGVALLFLTFLGLYPVVKGRIESLRRLGVEWGLKLSYFNLALTLFWFIFQGLFLPSGPQWLKDSALLCYGVGNLIFVVYDLGLSQLIPRLSARLRRTRGR